MKNILLSSSIVLAFACYSQMNGELDQSFNPALTTTGSIIVQDDGKILLGNGPNRLNADGSLDATYAQMSMAATQLIKDGTGVYGFGYGAHHYNASGNIDTPSSLITSHYGIGASIDNGRVKSAVKLPNGKIFVVGDFDYIYHNSGSFAKNRIMVYDATLGYDGSILNNIGSGFNDVAMWVDADTINEKVYVVGRFTSYNGNPANGICRLNYDGTFDATFNSGTGFPVTSSIYPKYVHVMSDGRVLVSGDPYFTTTYNGTSFNLTIMLNNDGTHNTTFQPPFPGVGNVYDLEELSNNRMIIASHDGTGGDLTFINSITGAQINGLPSGFGTLNNISNTYINNITKVEEGVYLLGGNFDTFSGEAKTNLVKVSICDRYVDPAGLITFNNDVLSSTITGSSYEWTAVDPTDSYNLTLTNNTSSTFTPTEPGFYYLTITDGPCVFESYYDLTNLGVNSIENLSFSLAPNPAKEQVTINNLIIGSTLHVTDMTGKVVLEEVVSTSEMNLDLNKLKNGIYFVQVTTNSTITGSKKLAITK